MTTPDREQALGGVSEADIARFKQWVQNAPEALHAEPVLDVEARAQELHQDRFPGKSWHGKGTSRSYWRRMARQAPAPDTVSTNEVRDE